MKAKTWFDTCLFIRHWIGAATDDEDQNELLSKVRHGDETIENLKKPQ